MIFSLSAAAQFVGRCIFTGPVFRAAANYTPGCRTFALSNLPIARRGALLLPVLLLTATAALTAQAPEAEFAARKVDKGFYTAKDRLNAMQSAALFATGKVSEADIAAGPPR
jgi:hypothetical protein